ncbi:MAG: uracil phosphoribosyltransferase [Synergistaceae bacterium]|nr:uracil phosphoribosyltransferase [Synergistaceae bacterium]
MKIALGADHAGFALKETIKTYLLEKGHETIDCGTMNENMSTDYPDWGFKTAMAVANNEADRGILICGTGIGMSMVANKVKGIRATLCHDHYTAQMSRKHNNSNILVLGSRVTPLDLALEITEIWLTTDFDYGKHEIRVEKINKLERECHTESSMSSCSCKTTPGKTFVVDHPLIQHKLSLLRDKNTSSKDFRDALQEISTLLVFPATKNLSLEKVEVETPIEKTETLALSGKKLAIVAVLRAGLGMVDGILRVIPNAKVGHIGLYRDPETLQPVDYYCKLPGDISERDILLVDPMLATGGSASSAADHLKKEGAKRIMLLSLLAAPEGIAHFHEKHPDIDIYVAAIDSHLNKNGYIVPGLGDAGDRLFGTK